MIQLTTQLNHLLEGGSVACEHIQCQGGARLPLDVLDGIVCTRHCKYGQDTTKHFLVQDPQMRVSAAVQHHNGRGAIFGGRVH